MKPKALATQWIPDEVTEAFADRLQLIYPSKEKISFSYEELKKMLPDFDCLFVISGKADKELIDAGTKLKVITNLGVGYDSIDVDYATEKNIAVINSPSSVTEATAELTIALIMATMRKIVSYDKSMREGKWIHSAFDTSATEIFGHTLGIVGFGRIGKSVCKKAQVMGMKVFYYNPHRLSPEDEKSFNVEYLSIDNLFAQCDCVSLHMPYTAESHHLVDEKRLSEMKKGAFLINAARGAIIKESALVEALNNGTLKGAALDVFEFEPHVSAQLLKCDNVVICPHIGTQTYGVRIDMCNESLTGAVAVLLGEKPYNLVNKNITI